jgi:preprotein translocase subunit SecF
MRILTHTNFDFIKWRWHALIASLLVILAGLGTMYQKGVPLGIDFTGGTVVVLQFNQPTSEETVRGALASMGTENVVLRYGPASENKIMVRLKDVVSQESGTNLEEGAKRVNAALQQANIGQYTVIDKVIIGPQIGADLQRKGIMATLTALAGILIYIAVRFRLTFAIGAIVATFHDILVTLVVLAWCGYDLSLNVIAAILTIAGYSVNDTIVVFDRVRENQRVMRREPLDVVVNKSVNQTLARTIITGGTTFLAVLSLYLFGGEVLKGFAFTMLVGIVTGTYSTIFIASAIAIILSPKGSAPGAPAQKAKGARA